MINILLFSHLPQWDIQKFINESSEAKGKPCDYNFSYNSGDNENFISIDNLKKIINDVDYE